MILTERTRTILDHIIQNQSVPNGLILTGPIGSFLHHAALYFAHNVNQQAPVYPPNPNNILIKEIKPEKSITIAQIRTLQNEIKYGSPQPNRTLSVIVYAADKMTTEAANAFLKTLEEPPQNVCFILLTAQLARCLPTIQSRCQILHLFKATPDIVVPHATHQPETSKKIPTEKTLDKTTDKTTDKIPQQTLDIATLAELETGEPVTLPYKELQPLLSASPSQKIKVAETLSKTPYDAHLTLHEWLRQWVTLYKTHPRYKQNGELLIEKIAQLQYNLNLRNHIETLLLNLTPH